MFVVKLWKKQNNTKQNKKKKHFNIKFYYQPAYSILQKCIEILYF